MMSVNRILDAAGNRVREGLRVMEDVARFVLDDADLCGELKEIRHALAAVLRGGGRVDDLQLIAWRDTPGDVGTTIGTVEEYRRENVGSVAAAAAKRVGEALRSIEECLKIGVERQPPHGPRPEEGGVEALRYRVYEVERRLLAALGTGRARQWVLCVLLTESMCEHMPWEDVARECILGGADCLQLREKGLADSELVRRARRLVAISREHATADRRAAVVINDRADIALLCGADGVHVGQEDMSVADVRRLAGSALLVGVSTTNMEEAVGAVRDGADCCGVGPMYPTTTKEKPRIAGAAYLREYVGNPMTARVPHLAIGGITPENVGELAAAGCRGVAVSGAVIKKQRPAVACRALRDGLAPTH